MGKRLKSNNNVCILDLTHKRLVVKSLLDNITNTAEGNKSPIVNNTLICGNCSAALSFEYANLVNSKQVDYSRELFFDSYIDDALKSLEKNQPDSIKLEVKKLTDDWQAYMREKIYTVQLKHSEDCLNYLNKQQWEIEDHRNDKTPTKYIIKFPPNRDFILADEIQSIHILSNCTELINVKDRAFTILK